MESFEGGDSLLDELHSLTQLLFGDNKRRRKADDVLVSRLSQNTEIAHLQADIPSLFSVFGFDNHGVEQALTTDFLKYPSTYPWRTPSWMASPRYPPSI